MPMQSDYTPSWEQGGAAGGEGEMVCPHCGSKMSPKGADSEERGVEPPAEMQAREAGLGDAENAPPMATKPLFPGDRAGR